MNFIKRSNIDKRTSPRKYIPHRQNTTFQHYGRISKTNVHVVSNQRRVQDARSATGRSGDEPQPGQTKML